MPYPIAKAPSQRFRVEQFLHILDDHGIRYKLATFLSKNTMDVLYKRSSVIQKILGVLKGYVKRWKHVLVDVHRYHTVFIHREAAPLGPPVFEWIVIKLLGKKVIYDFDDAIWIPNTNPESKLVSYFRSFWKVAKICKWSSVVTAGNHFLGDFARQSGAKKVVYLPTVVDTKNRYLPKPLEAVQNSIPVIGWTGSHSTLKYLDEILPVLKELEQTVEFKFLVIANRNPELPLKNFEFVKWNEVTEIEDLQRIDIGVMPLTHDLWSEGKCGFKLIQYLALGIPAIASPVGVNKVIIEHGTNGFLCETENDWSLAIKTLITDIQQRNFMGTNGRGKIEANYSITSQKQKILDVFSN